MLALICVVTAVLIIVGGLVLVDAALMSARRQHIEQRVRATEDEIDEIGRRTQAAILAAARRESDRHHR